MVMSLQEAALRSVLNQPESGSHLDQRSPAYPMIESAAHSVLKEVYSGIPLDYSVDLVTQLFTTSARIGDLRQQNPERPVKWDKSLASIFAQMRFEPLLRALKSEMEWMRRGPISGEEFAAFFDVNAFRSPEARRQFLQKAIARLDVEQAALPLQEGSMSSAERLLFLAVIMNYWEAVSDLASQGINLNIRGHNGRTPLHDAVVFIKLEGMRALLAAGADLNIQDNIGRTPLIAAVIANNQEAIRALITAGADLNIQDSRGETALSRAARLDNLEAIRALIEAGADLNVQDHDGKTTGSLALQYALQGNNPETIRVLIAAGANPDIQDNQGRSAGGCALTAAVMGNHLEKIHTLIAMPINVSVRGLFGLTGLQFAVGFNNLEALRALIEAGADLNMQGNDGWTALHLAARTNHSEAIRALIDAGADVNIRDNDGRTAYDLAVIHRNISAAWQLLPVSKFQIAMIAIGGLLFLLNALSQLHPSNGENPKGEL